MYITITSISSNAACSSSLGPNERFILFRLQGYDEVFYWEEEEKKINRSFGPREDEQAAFEEIDVIVMYNRDELVSPAAEDSVVSGLMKKYKNSPYHICYQTRDFDAAFHLRLTWAPPFGCFIQ